MPAIKDQAIVLRHLDYSETSQVLAVLTRGHGQQRLIGKGVKRFSKYRPSIAIDLLERGEVVFLPPVRAEAGLGTLTEWRQADAHLGLRRDLPRWYAGQYAAEITTAMTEQGDPHPAVFDALAELLATLCRGAEPGPAVAAYQRVVLEQAGLWPDLTRCVLCDRPAPPGRAAWFSAPQGGLLCRSCRPRIAAARRVGAAVLDALRERREDPAVTPQVLDLLDDTISHAIGRPTSMAGSPLTRGPA